MKASIQYSNLGLRYLKSLLILATLVSYTLISACSGDDGGGGPDPDPEAEFISKLSGPWSLSSAQRNGTDILSDYQGFTISFSSTGYTTQNGGSAWDDSGSWSFEVVPQSGGNTATLSLDGDISAIVTLSNNDQTLTVEFVIPETLFGTGRAQALDGNYLFVLGK